MVLVGVLFSLISKSACLFGIPIGGGSCPKLPLKFPWIFNVKKLSLPKIPRFRDNSKSQELIKCPFH